MATWLGMPPTTALLLLNTASTTSYAAAAFDRTARAEQASLFVTNAANVSNEPVDISPHTLPNTSAAETWSPGDLIFERIHVNPQTKVYSAIISTQTIPVEVWNAFRALSQQVSSVTITGPDGVSILTPYVLPIVFPPMASNVYIVQVLSAGPPQADNFIHWDFDGLPEPLFHLTGLRLVPFTISPDWAQGIDDTVAWLTDVMMAYDTTEQRMQLRAVPNRALSYMASALSGREAGLMASLLWAWQGRSYGVLLWMDGTQLSADVVAGTTVILVPTANMTIVDNVDTVILISDAFTWFASQIVAHDAISITLGTPTDKDFFAQQTQVIPLQLGKIADKVGVERPTNATAQTQIKFDLQVVRS